MAESWAVQWYDREGRLHVGLAGTRERAEALVNELIRTGAGTDIELL